MVMATNRSTIKLVFDNCRVEIALENTLTQS
jgi:hypothetical protein